MKLLLRIKYLGTDFCGYQIQKDKRTVQGELNRAGVPVERGCLEYHVPLHTVYGTEFKFIIDVADNSRYNSIMSIFAKAGMNPTSSESQIGGRIYLSLPERRAQGLFMLHHEFSNNFLCPHAARKH